MAKISKIYVPPRVGDKSLARLTFLTRQLERGNLKQRRPRSVEERLIREATLTELSQQPRHLENAWAIPDITPGEFDLLGTLEELEAERKVA